MENKTYLSDEDYNFIYSRSPRVTVDLYIVNSSGSILLTKRDIEPYKDHWHLPGGRIKFRETISDALKRISKAELGIDIESNNIIGTIQFLTEEQQGNPRHSISLVHLVRYNAPDGPIVKDGEFFKELPAVIIPEQKEFIENFRNNNPQ